MIKEAIDRILQLGTPNIVEQHGVAWTDKHLNPIQPLFAEPFTVQTLDGFIDLVKAPIDDATKELFVIHVANPTHVTLRQRIAAQGIRTGPLQANYTPPSFAYSQFLSPEQFIVALQSMFKDSDDLDYVLQLASNLRDEKVGTSQDDGISQTVTIRAGVALKEGIAVKKKISLAPMRTFPEVEQPASDFVLRLRSSASGDQPSLALFEADGGAWKQEAIDEIAEYIKAHLADHTIVS